jgi:single-strand DNA-binding protein
VNAINLTGRLTHDPERRETASDKTVVQMRLAVPRAKARGEREAVFVDVVSFDGLAAVCATYLTRGRKVAVTGRLEQDEWQASDGTRRSRHYVVASDVEFLDRARDEAEADDGEE